MPRRAGEDSIDAEFHADSESAIGNGVRGFAGDRQGLKVGQVWIRQSDLGCCCCCCRARLPSATMIECRIDIEKMAYVSGLVLKHQAMVLLEHLHIAHHHHY